MKLSKAIFLTVLAVGGLLACASVRAQDATNNMPAATPSTNAAPRRFMGRGMSVDAMANALDLTADQKPKFATILNDRNQKMHDVVQDTTLSVADKRAKLQQIRDDTTTQMKALLTDDQFQKWQHMSQMRRPRMMPPPPAQGATNGPAAPAP